MSSFSRLEVLEKKIRRYQAVRLEAAQALKEIWSDDLYEESDAGYSTIAEYALDRFGFRSSRTYQLIKYARVFAVLDDEEDVPVPKNEAQARYLGRLLDTEHEEEIPDIWSEALSAHEHGLDNLTMGEVESTIRAYLEDQKEEKEDPKISEVDLKVPTDVAERLGLDGDDDRDDRRVVGWNGYDRSDVQEIIDQTKPDSRPPPGGMTEEIGATVWTPLRGDADSLSREEKYQLRVEPPERVEFLADTVQQLQNSDVPGSNQSGNEGSDTLACPTVDLLSNGVPDALTEEVLDWSGGTDWSPIFHSVHHGDWTNYALPDDAWIGASADRGSIEEVGEALDAADDTEVKWALYNLGGEDRNMGFPEVDFSSLDWIVIDRLKSNNVDLSIPQLNNLLRSLDGETSLAVRGHFTTKLENHP